MCPALDRDRVFPHKFADQNIKLALACIDDDGFVVEIKLTNELFRISESTDISGIRLNGFYIGNVRNNF